MPEVLLERMISGSTPEEVFEQLKDIAQLPELSESVLKVDLREQPDGSIISDWDVMFRGGIMRWTELDVFDDDNLRFEFRQLEGDLASFDGYWQVVAEDDQVRLTLFAAFDLGMPTLADMLDPVAARALEEALDEVLEALIRERSDLEVDTADVKSA